MATLTGSTNNPPYVSDLPVNTTVDGDGTVRLCVSYGIPKQGSVTNFRVVNDGNFTTHVGSADGKIIYTCPGGKTFYIMGIVISNFAGTGQGFTYTFGSNIFEVYVPASNNSQFLGVFPLQIVRSGEKIVLTQNGDGTVHGGVTLWGYEEFGNTT